MINSVPHTDTASTWSPIFEMDVMTQNSLEYFAGYSNLEFGSRLREMENRWRSGSGGGGSNSPSAVHHPRPTFLPRVVRPRQTCTKESGVFRF